MALALARLLALAHRHLLLDLLQQLLRWLRAREATVELLCKKVACHATKLAIIKRVRKRRRESTVHNTQLEGQGTPRLLCLGLARRLRRSGATLVNTLCIIVVWPLQEGGGGERICWGKPSVPPRLDLQRRRQLGGWERRTKEGGMRGVGQEWRMKEWRRVYRGAVTMEATAGLLQACGCVVSGLEDVGFDRKEGEREKEGEMEKWRGGERERGRE